MIHPKKLFLIDGLGAMLSAFMLGIVLVRLEHIFGIPRQVLFLLASLPCIFVIYDFYCYQKAEANFGLLLQIIAIANLLYACLSIGLAFYHHEAITFLGWLYIIIEIIIIAILSIIELKTAADY